MEVLHDATRGSIEEKFQYDWSNLRYFPEHWSSHLIEFYLPIEEYLPRQHVPDMSAHGWKDIAEVVKTEYSDLVSNKDVLDLVFVLDPAFIDGKTNIIFWEWQMHFFVSVASLASYAVLLIFNHSLWHRFAPMDVQIVSKTHFPSMFLIGLIFSRNIAGMYFVIIQSNKAISATTLKSQLPTGCCVGVVMQSYLPTWDPDDLNATTVFDLHQNTDWTMHCNNVCV